MGSFLVRGLLALMTFLAGNFSVYGIQESLFINKRFFPRLQRSYFSPSTFP